MRSPRTCRVEANLSYNELKQLIKIPATWVAKITGDQFAEQTAKFLEQGKSGKKPRRAE